MNYKKSSHTRKPRQDLSSLFTLNVVKKKSKLFIKRSGGDFKFLGFVDEFTPPSQYLRR